MPNSIQKGKREEIWRLAIHNGEIIDERYEVSNLGNVRSWKWLRSNLERFDKPKTLTISLNGRGYLIVCLRFKRGFKSFKVHRMVAEAFIENQESKPQVNHKNGIKTDNRAENLEWCTNIQNCRDAMHRGKAARKLTCEQVVQIKKLYATNEFTYVELAKRFGVTNRNIGAIITGRVWQHAKA